MGTVEQKLKEFNKDIELFKLQEKYSAQSFFEMMSIARSENRHSAFLRWLFEGKEIPVNEQYSPLMRLLNILLERADQQNKDVIDSTVKTSILTKSLRLHNIEAKNEMVIGKLGVIPKSRDRIDIYITCDVSGLSNYKRFEFIIENKIDSTEGDPKTDNPIILSEKEQKDIDKKNLIDEYNDAPQTKRYLMGTNYSEDDKQDLHQFYIYLTPISSYKLSRYEELNGDERCETKEFIHINYQDIVDYIIDPLMASDKLSDRVNVFLKEYLNNLSMPCLNDETQEDEKNTYTIMATQKSDTETIKHFWENYKDIIVNGILLSKPIKISENGQVRSRQQLLNDAIIEYMAHNKYDKDEDFGKDVVSENVSYHVKLNNSSKWNVVDVMKNSIYLKQKEKTTFEELIQGKPVYNDLFLQYSFFKANEKFIMASMRILADLENPEYGTLRAIFEVYSNPKDNQKYIVKKNDKLLNPKNKNGKTIGLNKREVIICFIENFGQEIDQELMDLFNKRCGTNTVLSSSGKSLIKNESNYEKYRWISKRYKRVTDNTKYELLFSNKKWGCKEDGTGGFDKFLKLIEEKATEWGFSIESITPGQ